MNAFDDVRVRAIVDSYLSSSLETAQAKLTAAAAAAARARHDVENFRTAGTLRDDDQARELCELLLARVVMSRSDALQRWHGERVEPGAGAEPDTATELEELKMVVHWLEDRGYALGGAFRAYR
ncbi:hypothetical protein [Streptomyces noursei]